MKTVSLKGSYGSEKLAVSVDTYLTENENQTLTLVGFDPNERGNTLYVVKEVENKTEKLLDKVEILTLKVNQLSSPTTQV